MSLVRDYCYKYLLKGKGNRMKIQTLTAAVFLDCGKSKQFLHFPRVDYPS